MGLSQEEKERRKQIRRKEKLEREHRVIDGLDCKICNLHHKHFPDESPWIVATYEYFYKNDKNSIDGLHPRCKKCEIINAREIQLRNHEDYKAYLKQWKLDNPNYMPNYNKMYYAENTDKFYEKLARWQKENPERSNYYRQKKRHHTINKEEWESCKNYFNHSCAYCGLPIDEHINRIKDGFRLEDLHREHVDDQGVNDLSNCVCSCKSCNSEKGSYGFDDWYCEDNHK